MTEHTTHATHWIHSDSPTGEEPSRPGRFCGPTCDLFEDPDRDTCTDCIPLGTFPDGSGYPCTKHSPQATTR